MIIISVDYGDVRTGIAVCDKFEVLASPVCVINETDMKELCSKILEIASQQKAEEIVVGLPKNMDSTVGEKGEKCKELAELLKSESQYNVVMFDERLTTVYAHKVLNVTNVRGKKRKSVVDEVAAVVILQNYIDSRKNRQ